MKKISFNISFFILIFLFSIFALSNIGFVFKLPVNPIYILISLIIPFIFFIKKENIKYSLKLLSVFLGIFIVSLIFANLFIDTSFDGRCYHFTLENLFKLGFNPIYDNIIDFANKNNIFYNLLFAGSYPNLVELLRSNFYLIFNNMEASKLVNFLFIFAGGFYSTYFFLNKTGKIKALILSLTVFLCPVTVCQMNTKMIDFILYYIFLFQLISLILIFNKKDIKLNTSILVISSVMAIACKYTGVLNTFIIFSFYLIFNFSKDKLKAALLFVLLSFSLCFQPYITNIVKFKNPFYPSVGFNKLDFMTKQNPKEFKDKNYLYKFIRSMFSSASDARMGNPETPPVFWKVPFTNHFDMPFISEDVRMSGFGHLYSGIFILTILASIFLFKNKEAALALGIIYAATLLNPICWWARFVPYLYLSSVLAAFYIAGKSKKREAIFYIFTVLLIINGFWTAKENISVTAYKTYVMSNFYNNLYSKNEKILVYMDKTPYDEDDTTILPRLKEYGINFELVDKKDETFELIKTDCTISKSYYIKEENQK